MNTIHALTKREKAFVYVPSTIVDSSVHQAKLKQFINIINSCDLAIAQGAELPHNGLWSQYDYFFIDFFGQPTNSPVTNTILQLSAHHKVILFNINQDQQDEKNCLLAGISGVFYDQDRADIVLKGIEHIKGNGLWFKREVMGDALLTLIKSFKTKSTSLNTNQKGASANTVTKSLNFTANLTKREQMITALVSKGAKNQEIADQLHISPNTVKTHIYSIFRKTSSRNRIELMAWTQQFS
jgi:DNA-binding NarL/FixJ family response regulator